MRYAHSKFDISIACYSVPLRPIDVILLHSHPPMTLYHCAKFHIDEVSEEKNVEQTHRQTEVLSVR